MSGYFVGPHKEHICCKAVGTAEAGEVSASPLFAEVGVFFFARALIITLLFSLGKNGIDVGVGDL